MTRKVIMIGDHQEPLEEVLPAFLKVWPQAQVIWLTGDGHHLIRQFEGLLSEELPEGSTETEAAVVLDMNWGPHHPESGRFVLYWLRNSDRRFRVFIQSHYLHQGEPDEQLAQFLSPTMGWKPAPLDVPFAVSEHDLEPLTPDEARAAERAVRPHLRRGSLHELEHTVRWIERAGEDHEQSGAWSNCERLSGPLEPVDESEGPELHYAWDMLSRAIGQKNVDLAKKACNIYSVIHRIPGR